MGGVCPLDGGWRADWVTQVGGSDSPADLPCAGTVTASPDEAAASFSSPAMCGRSTLLHIRGGRRIGAGCERNIDLPLTYGQKMKQWLCVLCGKVLAKPGKHNCPIGEVGHFIKVKDGGKEEKDTDK